MDWSRGYSCAWRLFRVDAATFLDRSIVGGVDSASIDRTVDGLLESASLTLTRDAGVPFQAGYYRLVLVATQDRDAERAEVATLWCSSAKSDGDHGIDVIAVEGRGVLWPASRRKLRAGTYAPAGTDGALYAARLLRECMAAPVVVDGTFTVAEHVVFDLGSTYLDAARAVLDAAGWQIVVDGHGTVTVRQAPTRPALDLTGGSVVPGITRGYDTSEVHNAYTAISGGITATATNDDPASEVSTVARGYVDDEIDNSPTPLAGETLAAYARRRLAEQSIVGDTYGYTREWVPGIHPGDLVRLRLNSQAVDATARVTRQRLDCAHGIKVTEEAQVEVALWTP